MVTVKRLNHSERRRYVKMIIGSLLPKTVQVKAPLTSRRRLFAQNVEFRLYCFS